MNITSMNTMTNKKKTSQGRQKIEIKKIEPQNSRQVTFSKRRAGLFKKASELCILTGAQIAILANSPGGHLFSFGHPNAEVIIDRYLSNSNSNSNSITITNTTATITNNNNNNNNNNIVYASEGSTSHNLPPVMEFNQHYMEVSKELEAEKRRREVIQEAKAMTGNGLMWYEEAVDGMEVDDLEAYLLSLIELKRKVLVRADELMMIKKTPIFLGPSMGPSVGVAGYVNDVVDNTMNQANVMPPAGFGFGFGFGFGLGYNAHDMESMHY